MSSFDRNRFRANLAAVRDRIAAACRRAGRDPSSVTLVAVTKTLSAEHICRLAEEGITDVGENRPVEGVDRVGRLAGIRRHMIGRLQTNKVRKALAWADVLHSVDRDGLVEALEAARANLPVFVQVNVSGEASKAGFRPEDARSAVERARRTLDVRGLMTMAPEGVDARPYFRRLRALGADLGLPWLSMGMTQDYETAVEEGATHVRVGTGLFEGVEV
ncbi:MAG TPA: YggS family pyridoxal phosphate-dependent enzyme [Planctomycetota bacterium]|nr:YggS family pyridoxal phosphate-dependent enzyme [Planctomycetota bacterium]